MYTIAQAKQDLAGIIHGKTVSKITNINAAAARAGRNLLAMIDPDETRKIGQISFYDKIVDYASVTGLKEKGIIDVRPQFDSFKPRSAADNLSNRMSKDFDMRRSWGSWLTVMNDGGLQYLRVKAELTPSANTLDALDALGGWAATAAAQNLAVEDIIFSQGALEFDIAAGANPTTGYIQSTTINSIDFTDLVNKSSAFLTLYIPTAAALAAITSIDLEWGNDTTTKFYNRTVTAQHLGALRVGKNTLRFDWNGATKTGTIDVTAIDSARITVTTDGTAISGLIVSNLFFALANVWDVEYYSKYLFSNSAGVWSDVVTSDDDTINLDTTSYNLFLYEFAIAGLQQIQGKDARADREHFEKELYGDPSKADRPGKYAVYKTNNPSQREKVTQTYYPLKGFRGNYGDKYKRQS